MKKITRVAGIALCLALIMMGSCSLVEPYKEINPSSLEDSGGTAPETQEEAIAFVKEFLGIAEPALQDYLLNKIKPESKAATPEKPFAFNVNLGYKGPANDDATGTADVKGSLKGVLPYDGLFIPLSASTDYSFTGLTAKLLLSGELKKLALGDYSLVDGKLKNDSEFNTDVTFTTAEDTYPDEATIEGNLELKLKMSNGFSVKNIVSGEGVKFTIFADDDVKDTWENLLSPGTTAMEEFTKKIKFTINVYNDANALIGSEELSLYDLL